MAEKKVPVGVKVISVLYYIGAVFGVLFGILFMAGAGLMGTLATQIPGLGLLGSGLFVVGGLVMIGIGVLGFFVGRGLWKAHAWARIVAIVFAALGILMAIISMVQGNIASNLFGLVLNLAIGGYLLLSSDVKAAFA